MVADQTICHHLYIKNNNASRKLLHQKSKPTLSAIARPKYSPASNLMEGYKDNPIFFARENLTPGPKEKKTPAPSQASL